MYCIYEGQDRSSQSTDSKKKQKQKTNLKLHMETHQTKIGWNNSLTNKKIAGVNAWFLRQNGEAHTNPHKTDRQTEIYIEVLCTDYMIQAHTCNPSTRRQRSEDREKFKVILYDIERWSRKEKQEECWDSNTSAWMHVTLVGIIAFKSIIKWWDHTRLH